jgi:hypothetical protein
MRRGRSSPWSPSAPPLRAETAAQAVARTGVMPCPMNSILPPRATSASMPFRCKSGVRRKSARRRGVARFGCFVVVLWGMKGEAVRLARTLSAAAKRRPLIKGAATGRGHVFIRPEATSLGNAVRDCVQKPCPGPRQAASRLSLVRMERTAQLLLSDQIAAPGWPDWHTRARADC